MSWQILAVISALAAGATSVLAKVGLEDVPSNLANAVRTAIVLVLSIGVVLFTGEHKAIATKLDGRAWLFLALSGVATSVSWIAYFKALQLGSATPVTAIDKASLARDLAAVGRVSRRGARLAGRARRDHGVRRRVPDVGPEMSARPSRLAAWLRDRSLTLTMLGLFAVCAVGQLLAGWFDFNETATSHGQLAIPLAAYVTRGHLWEALFENWESEFLQMSAFVVLSAYLYQVGSPESRRPGARELVDADPRAFSDQPDVPWAGAARRLGAGPLRILARRRAVPALPGVVRRPCPRRLGRAERRAAAARSGRPGTLLDYATSSRFWFESLQNWQSEFLSVGAMVWLAVYLRQRGSPESKPVHAPHAETGR